MPEQKDNPIKCGEHECYSDGICLYSKKQVIYGQNCSHEFEEPDLNAVVLPQIKRRGQRMPQTETITSIDPDDRKYLRRAQGREEGAQSYPKCTTAELHRDARVAGEKAMIVQSQKGWRQRVAHVCYPTTDETEKQEKSVLPGTWGGLHSSNSPGHF
jgi:hypothetical protein